MVIGGLFPEKIDILHILPAMGMVWFMIVGPQNQNKFGGTYNLNINKIALETKSPVATAALHSTTFIENLGQFKNSLL